jgi:hypothetical protein
MVMSNFINKQLKRIKMKTNEVMRLCVGGLFVSTEVVLLRKLGRNEVLGHINMSDNSSFTLKSNTKSA